VNHERGIFFVTITLPGARFGDMKCWGMCRGQKIPPRVRGGSWTLGSYFYPSRVRGLGSITRLVRNEPPTPLPLSSFPFQSQKPVPVTLPPHPPLRGVQSSAGSARRGSPGGSPLLACLPRRTSKLAETKDQGGMPSLPPPPLRAELDWCLRQGIFKS